MTAKTKHGHKAHGPTRGADPGTPHERLNRQHARVGRAEGAASNAMNDAQAGSSGDGANMPEAPMAPPMGAGPPGMGGGPQGQSTGEGPDTEEGEQS